MISRAVFLVSLAGFSGALFARAVDPIIPPIAVDLAVDPKAVALLSSAFAFPFALITPLLGPLSDIAGKTRFIIGGIVLLVVSGIAAALAPNFEVLLLSRVIAGIAAASIFPISLAFVSDLVPVANRQVMLGRLLMVIMTGTILGAALSGAIGDLVGWRGVFVVMTVFGAVALVGVPLGLRGLDMPQPPRVALRAMPGIYRDILANPRARVCYSAVFVEGAVVFGLVPYVALLLHAAGEDRASIAGVVIAGFSFGGIGYTLMVRRMLVRLSPVRLMLLGGGLVSLALAAAAANPPWPALLTGFVVLGFGFYTLHGYLQVQSTEMSTARGAALSLHATAFFLGQATGPVVYAIGFAQMGAAATLVTAAAVFLTLGVTVSRLLADGSAPAVQPAEPAE